MSGRYEKQIWPYKVICPTCETQLGAWYEWSGDKLVCLLLWCPKCEDWKRIKVVWDEEAPCRESKSIGIL